MTAELPVSLLAVLMFGGLGVATVSALLAIPRLSAEQTEMLTVRRQAEEAGAELVDLRRKVELSTSTVVNLKTVLGQAEAALSDARAQIRTKDIKLAATETVIRGMKMQAAQREAERPQPAKQEQRQPAELHSD